MAKGRKEIKQKKDYNNDASTVSGIHIYEDEKGRKLYYNPRKLTGYVIKNENVKSYRTYANRHVTALAAGMVTYILSDDWNLPIWIAFAVGIGIWALLEYRFRHVFLANLVQVHNFVPKQKAAGGMINSLANQDAWRLLAKAVLMPVFGILLIILFYQRQADTLTTLVGYVILIAMIVMAIINVLAFARKSKDFKSHS